MKNRNKTLLYSQIGFLIGLILGCYLFSAEVSVMIYVAANIGYWLRVWQEIDKDIKNFDKEDVDKHEQS